MAYLHELFEDLETDVCYIDSCLEEVVNAAVTPLNSIEIAEEVGVLVGIMKQASESYRRLRAMSEQEIAESN